MFPFSTNSAGNYLLFKGNSPQRGSVWLWSRNDEAWGTGDNIWLGFVANDFDDFLFKRLRGAGPGEKMIGASFPSSGAFAVFWLALMTPVAVCFLFYFGRAVKTPKLQHFGSVLAFIFSVGAIVLIITFLSFIFVLEVNEWLLPIIWQWSLPASALHDFKRNYGGWMFWVSYCLFVWALNAGAAVLWRKR